MLWIRAIWVFLLAATFAVLAAALADETGFVLIRWLGYEIETTIVMLLAILAAILLIYFLLALFLRPIFSLFRRN